MKLGGLARGSAIAGLALAMALPALAQAAKPGEDQGKQLTTPDTQSEQDRGLEQRRKRLVRDAVAALEATQQAIQALDDKDGERALAQLEIATGKLDLLVTRHPEAAALPVDVDVSEVDVIGSDEDIAAIVEQAEDALEDGRVQLARRLLTPLGSELVFTTTELPLVAYPAAMRLAAPLIEKGKLEEARAALEAALDTLIVRSEIVPLPVLRAELLLAAAEKQLNAPPVVEAADDETPADADRNDEPTPGELLAAARRQLDRASALGYGKAKETYPDLAERLEKLEGSLPEEPTPAWTDRLAKLRASLEELGSSLLE